MGCLNLLKFKTIIEDVIPENSYASFTGQLVDEKDVGLLLSNLTTFRLTLYDNSTEVIINSKSSFNILNVGGATVDANGNFVFGLNSLDNVILGLSNREVHVILLEWTYSAGTRANKHKVEFEVFNFIKVT